MSLRTTLFPIILLFCSYGMAQVSDDFSDGDFTSDPVWSGDVSLWQITSGQLNSNNTGTNTYYLSTVSDYNELTEWSFYVNLKFSTSGSNYVDVFLSSDNSDLTSTQNGYFVRVGNTQDEIVLYKLIAGAETPLIDNAEGTVNSSSNNPFGIKVTRDGLNNWTLFYDDGYTGSYVEAGSIVDNSFTSGTHFGFQIIQSSASGPIGNHFFDDIAIKGLDIDTVIVNSATEIIVDFSMPISQSDIETTSNYSISGITISSATQDAAGPSKVALTLDGATPLLTNSYTISVSTDLTKNDAINYDFDYTQLELSQLLTLSETEIQLVFNDELDEASAETASNYSIDNGIGQPLSASLDTEDQKRVNLTLGNSLIESTTFQLSASGIENSSGNSTFSGSQDFTFVIPVVIDTLYATSENSCLVVFNKSLSESVAETVTNYSLDGGVGLASSAVLQSDEKSVELAFDATFSDQAYTLTVSNVEDLDGNVIADNSIGSFDYLNLAITSLTQEGDNGIAVTFNQDIDPTNISTLTNYSLTEMGAPSSASLNSSNQLILTWSKLYNSLYELSITGIDNIDQNSSPEVLTSSIQIVVATEELHLVINEFLADPTPSVGMPIVEFVEIYNTSDYSINIENFTLDGQTIGAYQIPGNGYVVLTDESNLEDFVVSNKIGVSSMGALTNSGDQIVLKDQFGNLVDSINYVTTEWFSDSEKSAGGYSLERVDPLQPCSDGSNWIGTENEGGGTPGEQNSVFNDVDEMAPNLVSIEVIGGDTLLLVFSEPIDESSLSISSFSLEGFTFSEVIPISFSSYYAVISSELVSEESYTLEITDVSDCRDNIQVSQSSEFYYDAKPPVLDYLALISSSEVALVFDEKLHISNAEDEGSYYLNGFTVDRAVVQDSATNRVHVSFEEEFTLGESYALGFANLADENSNVLDSTGVVFEYRSAIDSVWIETANVLLVKYNDEPSSTALAVTNYLLDADVRPTQIVGDLSSNLLYRLSFSDNFEANNEFILYISNITSQTSSERLITPAVTLLYDTRPPTVSQVLVENANQLLVVFAEPINSETAQNSANFELEDGEQPIEVSVESSTNVRLTFNRDFRKAETLSVKNIADIYGNIMTSTRRVEFAYDVTPPVISNSYQISTDEIAIDFNEQIALISALTLANYSIAGINPVEVKILGPDSTRMRLRFESLGQQIDLNLSVVAIEDPYGNVSTEQVVQINTLQPRIVELIGSVKSSVKVSYSQPVQFADVVTNYILPGFTINEVVRLSPSAYELKISEEFQSGDSLHLSVQNIIGTNNQALQNTSFESLYSTGVESISVLNDQTISIDFESSISSLTSENFEIMGYNVLLVSQDSDDPSFVRLTLENKIQPDEPFLFSWMDIIDVFGSSYPDYSQWLILDQTAPTFASIQSGFFGKMTLTFSEPLEESSIASINKYQIEGIGTPDGIEVLADSIVLLDFSDQLNIGQTYTMFLAALSDQSGNVSMQDTISFEYNPPTLPEYQDLIITEIMADPTPSAGLPEVEYIEIYNLSNRAFDLQGLILYDENNEVRLPSYLLETDSYVVLMSDNNRYLFERENVLGVDGFPGLTNSGESLTLKTVLNLLIDSLHYESSWYHDSVKDEGGFSLERISFTGTCSDEQNWKATTDETGGTPGEQNSVFREGSDSVAPTVSVFSKISNSEVLIEFSEPMDSLSLLNVTFSVEETNVISRDVSGDNHEFLSIRFNELAVGSYYVAIISGARDCTGTLMNDTTFVFGYGRDPQPGELEITEVMADPDPSVGLPSAEYIEVYNNTDELLSLANVRFRDSNTSRLLGDYLITDSAYVIITSAEAAIEFADYGQVIGLADWPSLTNSGETISLATDITIDEVSYEDDWYLDPEKKSGGYSLEMINPNSACPTSSNWSESQDVSGGTPGRQNSIYSDGPDGTKPLVASFEVVDSYTLRFTFNEVMDSLSLLSANVEGVIARNRLVTDDRNQELTVELLTEIDAATEQVIRLSNVMDCSGNSIDPVEFTVALGVAPQYNDLIISEIMADPDPTIGLPSAEYLELYNRSTSVLTLEGVQLMDATDTVDLPAVTVLSGGYLVLTSTSRVGDFDPSIQVVGVSGWSALNNSGERLSLVYRNQVMFEVTYDVSWHIESAKDGGYSLEMKDLNNPCGGKENWTSSSSPDGGTPGIANAASEGVPDNFGPTLLAARAVNTSVVELVFNEPLGINSPENTVLIFEPSLAVRSISFGETNRSLNVYLEDNLVKNQPVQIEVFGAIDCLGNSVQTNSASFVLSDEGVVGDVVLNEVLFNPRTEGVDFIELLNTSSKYIDLYGWALGNEREGGVASGNLILEHYILKPSESVAISTDTITVKNQYPQTTKNQLQVSSIPSMPNTNGEVLVFNSSGEIMDLFSYDEDFHLSFLESVDGVSLERIDPKSETQDPDNWTSASSAVGFATPGALNSQQFDVPLASATVSIEPKVFVPGNRSAAHQSFTTINYQLDQAGQFANVTVYNQMGQPVADLARGESLGTTGFFRWDGTSYGGSVVRRGYYVVLFELYDNSGNAQTLKQTVVVGK
ncbi:lamin tail domain-containing protein [Marinoscillum pacificum]|uniref:lamin tail domain-containing protein n=1 Tax=Marinoscillum pacificum TaxID=392723 RepID=UPI00215776B0|nr:lamin tail domain-containing protein [Marinoscillum pacificum]